MLTCGIYLVGAIMLLLLPETYAGKNRNEAAE